MSKQPNTGRTRGSAPTPGRDCRPQADLRDKANRLDYYWIDRPQRGHNILAHGSAVGVWGEWD